MDALAALPPFVQNNGYWLLPAVIVIAGLFVYGLRDLIRLSPARFWAIGQVCFRDAIRRKVLWITPLAMLGIVIVSQLQKPVDEYDAIRLTTKLCFFTTGIVVTIISIITACTNLPREIESRVVYTIVTKPVTRLEIILGKLVGFARVTGTILLIMGVFSFAYLEFQSWWLGRQIDQTLASPSLDDSARNWLTHYQQTGLLVSQSVSNAQAIMQYARPPTSPDDRWIQGTIQDAIVPFSVPPEAYNNAAGVALLLHIKTEAIDAKHPPTTPPTVSLQLLDPRSGSVVMAGDQFVSPSQIQLTDPTGATQVVAQLSPEKATQLAGMPNFIIQVICNSADHLYSLGTKAVTLGIIDSQGKATQIQPFAVPILRGTAGRSGQQLKGPDRGVQPVAVFQFRHATIGAMPNGQVPFELYASIDHSGVDTESGTPTDVEARVYDRPNQKLSPPVIVHPENRKTVFFTLPGEYFTKDKDGNVDFDIFIRNRTPGHTVTIADNVLSLVSQQSSFAVNLLKGLVVLWLFAILTAAVALCCSTFLSWPIAVVLTVLVILGNWMVSNLDLGSGLGAQIANEFFQNNSAVATTVNQSVESLTKALQLVAGFLPDIAPFGVTEQIERGVTITGAQFWAPIQVLLLFGLPLVTASYVFLRNKEVAP